jgi:hypothetical protein
MSSTRAVHHFVSPQKEVNAGLWTLFAGATVFLGLRVYCKLRRSGLWWDDYILFVAWVSETLKVLSVGRTWLMLVLGGSSFYRYSDFVRVCNGLCGEDLE